MRTLCAALVLAVAVPSSAGSALNAPERVAALAAAAGLSPAAPQATPVFAPVTARPSRRLGLAAASGPVSGTGYVTGSGFLNCSSQDPRQPGYFSGWVRLTGSIPVSGPDGASGSIPMEGSAFVSGSCSNGGGFATGSASLSGSGRLYKDGRAVGRADVSGHVFLNRYVSGYAWFNEYISVNGRFQAD